MVFFRPFFKDILTDVKISNEIDSELAGDDRVLTITRHVLISRARLKSHAELIGLRSTIFFNCVFDFLFAFLYAGKYF